MRCSLCGGLVEWQGPLTNLTHTKCLRCGAINSQEPESPVWEYDTDEDGETDNADA